MAMPEKSGAPKRVRSELTEVCEFRVYDIARSRNDLAFLGVKKTRAQRGSFAPDGGKISRYSV